MKAKLTRTDGSILEAEGSVEECAALMGLATINVGPPPLILYPPAPAPAPAHTSLL